MTIKELRKRLKKIKDQNKEVRVQVNQEYDFTTGRVQGMQEYDDIVIIACKEFYGLET